MNVNLYKIDIGRLNDKDIGTYLCGEDYVEELCFKTSQEDNDLLDLEVRVWIESRDRQSTDWQNEIERLMNENKKQDKNTKIFEDLGALYNAIIVVEHELDLYALPFGHAYNTVAKVCDREFGMDIASRQIEKKDVSSENVNKYFSNVIAQQTYYSQSTVISTEYFESYEGITGSPKNEVFGRKITCSQSVRFKVSKLEDVIVKVIPKLSDILSEEEIFSIPRVNHIPKSNSLSQELHRCLLNKILERKSDETSLIEIPDNFFINNKQYNIHDITEIYVESNKTESVKKDDDITSWQHASEEMMRDYEVTLDKIRFTYVDEDQRKNRSLSDIARIDLSYHNEQYMLVDGYWCEFNTVYLEHINEEVNKINYELNRFLYKEGIESLKNSDLPENIDKSDNEKPGLEDRIIEYYASDEKYTKFHKKLVKPLLNNRTHGNGNELCDLAFEHNDKTYLVSSKISFDTDSFLKCIDQSLYSLQILRDPSSFEVQEVKEFLNPDYIAIHIILRKNYLKSKDVKHDSHIKIVESGEFKFDCLKSNLVKNKLLEWQTKVREFGFEPMIFIDVVDMEKSN